MTDQEMLVHTEQVLSSLLQEINSHLAGTPSLPPIDTFPEPTPVPPIAPVAGTVMLGDPGQPPIPTKGNTASNHQYIQNTTYCFLWTEGSSLAISTSSGENSNVEIGVAPVAGDWDFAQTHAFSVPSASSFFPVVYHPHSSGDPAGSCGISRPPTNCSPAFPTPYYCFFRVTDKSPQLVVQLSL